MDIKEWLQNAAYREPPDEQEHSRFPNVPQPQLGASKPARPSHRHKRKRVSSDPPANGADRGGHGRHRRAHSSSSDHVRLAQKETAAADSRSGDSSHGESSASSRERGPVRSYDKRARHKTRPDRYERKPAKRKEQEPHRAKKSKSKRRKGHPTGDGARTTGLVQSFQLKNGPKNNRLTLRPEASAGIFNHGRASAPMAASGPGLPDLVFNEMKFLSKPRDQDKAPPNRAAPQIKKSRKELREEEISAYFRNVTAERRTGEQGQHEQISGMPTHVQPTIEDVLPPVEQVDRHMHARAPVELPEKPFLGFGSRGVPQEKQDLQSTSKSYYTWSESIAPPRREHASPDERHSIPLQPPSRETRRVLKERNPAQQVRRNESALEQPRSRLSEHAPYLETALGSTISAPRARPEAASEPGVCDHNQQQREADSYHTSDILKLRDTFHPRNRSPSLPRARRSSNPSPDQENIVPVTSTPTSKLLLNAWEAVSRPQQFHQSSSRRRSSDFRCYNLPQPHPHPGVVVMEPTSQHFDDTLDYDHGRAQPAELIDEYMPQRGFSRTGESYISQHGQPLRSASATTSNSRRYRQTDPFAPYTGRLTQQLPEGYEMLDNAPRGPHPTVPSGNVYANSRQAEDLVRQLAADQVPNLYGQSRRTPDVHIDQHASYDQNRLFSSVDIGQEDNIEHRKSLDGPFFTEPASMQMDALDHEYHTEIPFVEPLMESEHADTMTGFWRPNVLY